MKLLLNRMHISYEISKANSSREQDNSIGANMLVLQCTLGILLDKLVALSVKNDRKKKKRDHYAFPAKQLMHMLHIYTSMDHSGTCTLKKW